MSDEREEVFLLLKATAKHVLAGDARSADPKVRSIVVGAQTYLDLLAQLDESRAALKESLYHEGIEREARFKGETQVAQMREALIDRRGGYPQCRGCYAYLDGVDQHIPGCWAKLALSSSLPLRDGRQR